MLARYEARKGLAYSIKNCGIFETTYTTVLDFRDSHNFQWNSPVKIAIDPNLAAPHFLHLSLQNQFSMIAC